MITMQSHSDWKYTMALLKRPLFWRWVGLIIAIEWNKKKNIVPFLEQARQLSLV